jgi:hypothetical protein
LSGLWTQDPLEVFSGAQHLPELRRADLILSTETPAVSASRPVIVTYRINAASKAKRESYE